MTYLVAKAAGAIAALGLAACLGAWFKPPRIETREVTRDVVRELAKVEYRDRVQYVDRVQTIRRVVRVVVNADGSKTVDSTTDTGTAEKTAARELAAKTEQAKEISHEHERTVSAPARDDWQVGLFALRPLSGLLDPGQGWGGGAYVSRRLVWGAGATAVGQRAADGSWHLGVGVSWNF
jgi:hypothetical protein